MTVANLTLFIAAQKELPARAVIAFQWPWRVFGRVIVDVVVVPVATTAEIVLTANSCARVIVAPVDPLLVMVDRKFL